MQVSLSLLVAYIASTAAASPLSGSRVVAPALTFAQPTPLTNTLVLRGGGAVPEGAAITTASLFFGFYAIGFLIDPQMLTTMNFAGVPPLDTFHKWLCRILACGFLSYIAAINVADNKVITCNPPTHPLPTPRSESLSAPSRFDERAVKRQTSHRSPIYMPRTPFPIYMPS